MTVKELKAILERYSDDTPVVLFSFATGSAELKPDAVQFDYDYNEIVVDVDNVAEVAKALNRIR